MKHNELVSIITPMYNCEKYIEETINSVLNQTYDNWEMIVVDDFSTDSGPEIVKRYVSKDKRIKLLSMNRKSSNGPVDVRNAAIKEAKGRFIAFLDSDDLWDSNKLDIQITFMIENNIAFSYSNYRILDDNSGKIISDFVTPRTASYHDICKGNFIGCLTTVYDTLVLGKIFIVDAPKREDFETWLYILKKIKYANNVPTILATYRLRTNSFSSNKRKLIKYHWNVYRNVEKISDFKSLYYRISTIFYKLFKKY